MEEMGEYPALSDQDILAIKLRNLKMESGKVLDGVTLSVDFLNSRTEI